MIEVIETRQLWTKVPEGINLSINSDQEVLGYNELWKDSDLCPDGIRACFTTQKGQNGWQSTRRCKCNEAWINDMKAKPTHYMLKPKFEADSNYGIITDCELLGCSLNSQGTCVSTNTRKCKNIPPGMIDLTYRG